MLCFGNVYGPVSAHKKGVITMFAKALLTGEPMVIHGDGTASRDFLYVSNFCDGIIGAVSYNVQPGSIFHLASGGETSAGEIARLMMEIAGAPGHPVEHRPVRAGEVSRNFASYDRARDVLGF